MRQEELIWPERPEDARHIQQEVASRVDCSQSPSSIRTIGGIDTAYNLEKETIVAAVVVYDYDEMTPLARIVAAGPVRFPYHPGLFVFREGPVILEAISRLKHRPDVFMIAAHGIAHPKRCGMASHLGVLMDCPTIGCARRRLCGEHDDLDTTAGAEAPLFVHNQVSGTVLRSRDNVKPIFISPGHKCDIESARDIVAACLRGFRLPEPIRAAHRMANKAKRTIVDDKLETTTGK